MAIALIISRQSLLKKLVTISVAGVLVIAVIFDTKNKTAAVTGTKTFSAFSGWQLANNALHILRYDTVNPASVADTQTRSVLVYIQKYFDTTPPNKFAGLATAFYLWSHTSPLKKYMTVYAGKKNKYFLTWNALGPVYNKFGETIILKKPGSYIEHFVVPNIEAYCLPPLEVYEEYCAGSDTLSKILTTYYKYKTLSVPERHRSVYRIVFKPLPYIFAASIIAFVTLAGWYLYKRKIFKEVLFSKVLFCFTCFYFFNFLFIVLLAPSVIRYHLFILTLMFPIVIYIFQLLISKTGPDDIAITRVP